MKRAAVLGVVLSLAVAPAGVRAACNLIPLSIQTFRSSLGATNKPFAAPGDFVEVGVHPTRCDGLSPGLQPAETDQDVTLVFTPPSNGTKRVVLLTAGTCAAAASRIAACEQTVGANNVACVAGGAAALTLVDRADGKHLSFRFPDTTGRFTAAGFPGVLAGPVKIAVVKATDPLPCGLATATCATQPGTIACIDGLYNADGTCQPNPHLTFPSFTALPPPTDYQAACFADSPPCTALADETRFTVDTAGNLLLPVNWTGILVRDAGVPVPRLLSATIRSPLPFAQPPTVAFGSFTPEGAPLPPIFEPQATDPNTTAPNTISLIGTADAAYTILRVARRHGICSGGTTPGAPCTQSPDCGGGGTCPVVCAGGSSDGAPCVKDGDCPGGGLCGALFADFRPVAKSGSPIALTRDTNLICQEAPHQTCSTDGTCAGISNTCVSYALEARTPVPLEGLAGSDDVFAFSVRESIAQKFLNGDADKIDSVLLLQDRATGRQLPIGSGGSLGRPVMATQQAPFTYPMLATEDRVVAFLQPEALEGSAPAQANANGDDDTFDTILRVFKEDPNGTSATELTTAPAFPTPLAVDAALRVNGRSLAVSQGNVFFRTPEDGAVDLRTFRVSVSDTGAEANDFSSQDNLFGNPLSADGRFVVFESIATNLVAGGTSGRQVFLRDRDADADGIFDEVGGAQTTELVSKTAGGALGNGSSGRPTISANGRYVAFVTGAGNLITGGAACPNGLAPAGPCNEAVVKDRQTGNVITVSRQNATTAGNGDADYPSITPNGRFVVFESTAANLASGDANSTCDNNFDSVNSESCTDIFVYDRDSDGNGVFDEPGGTATELVSVDENGQQGNLVNKRSRFPAISDDGRFVVFYSEQPLVSYALASQDVYLRDRALGTTRLVSKHPDQLSNVGAIFPTISGNGRYVAFESTFPFVPNASVSVTGWAWDRVTEAFEDLNRSSEGAYGNFGAAGGFSTFSTDGRFAMVLSQAMNLVPGKSVNCRGTGGDCYEFVVRDRVAGLTKGVSVTNAGTEMNGEVTASAAAGITPDGRTFSFTTYADDVIGAGNDTNLCFNSPLPGLSPCPDVFVRTPDYTQAAAADRTGDADFNDTVLEVLDTRTGTRTALCPATEVAAADGRAAFIRPAAAGMTTGAKLPLCPAGAPASDAVFYWPGSGAVQDLALPGGGARTVAMSANYVAAVGASGTVQVKPLAGGPWVNSGQAAESIQFCGDVVALLQPFGADYTLRLYAPGAGTLPLTVGGVQEIVCNDQLLAYRVREAALGVSQNDDATYPDSDPDDYVLYTYDLATSSCRSLAAGAGCTGNPQRAVTACRLATCDPRVPYRVNGATVKFLTSEDEQGQHDLNGDGDAADFVINVYDMATDTVVPYGTIPSDDPDTLDPFPGGEVGNGSDPASSGSGSVYSSSGRCLETVGGSCTSNAGCAAGEFCDAPNLPTPGTCRREHGVCLTDDQCPPGIPCVTTGTQRGTTPASPDTDGDGIPDHVDNCPATANATQLDADLDGVGDVCDLATCGNDVPEYDEQCDGTSPNTCATGCATNCTCASCGPSCAACDNPILDLNARVIVKTLNELGLLVAKATLPLSSFDAETPVTVRLEDTDSTPIVQARVAAIPATGTSGTTFALKSKSDGLQKVLLKQRQPGQWLIKVKGKHWFTAAQANQTAADTLLTLTVGTQCFTHAGTVKIE